MHAYDDVIVTPKWLPPPGESMHQNDNCAQRLRNAIEALVDMYLLSHCKYLIFPGSSTFSWIAAAISEARPENIIDVERYSPSVVVKRVLRRMVP